MISLTFAIIMSIFVTVKAQVVTRVLAPDDKIENYIPWYNPNMKILDVETPLIDVEAVLEEDRRTGREMPRIGIKQDVNYTTRNGRLTEFKNYSLWEMVIHSKNAKSMSIRFDNTILPNEAVMFLYNEETRFVVGPITHSVFKDRTFRSDYLNGDKINITIFNPNIENQDNLESINITTFDHGISGFSLFDESYDQDYGGSESCNVNVACELGISCEVESVCKIIHSSIGSCTGTLVNNDCCDLTPFILTANHCTAGNPVDDYLFRFNYQSPQCTPTGETTPSQWIVYFGSELRANWGGTDFALLELTQDFEADQGMSFAGWDRSNYIGNNTRIIHHPSGDVKKITFDNAPPEIEIDETLNYPPNLVAGRYFRIELSNGQNGDFGIAEGGTSGAPYFNDNNRIYAQHRGGPNLTCTNTNNRWAGRINASWEGNGTNTTRLRNWLGASTNPNTMDCMENPYINGPDILCTDAELFALVNNMPCSKNVTWSVIPTNLFQSPTSGNGDFAILSARPNVNGYATLTYELTSNGCDPAFVSKEFWVGKPDFDIFGETELCIGDRGEAFLLFNSPVSAANIQWNFYGAVSGYGGTIKARYRANYEGAGWVCASITNECGTTEKCLLVWVEDCDGGWGKGKGYKYSTYDSNDNKKLDILTDIHMAIYPNPTNDIVNIKILNADDKLKCNIQILDTNGKIIKSISTNENLIEINISDQPSGIYFIQCTVGDKIMYNKLLKS